MTERTTNTDIAVTLAEIKKDLHELKGIIGAEPDKGLRGEVSMLVGIKNKGWGIVVGLLLLAGGAGAAIKTSLAELLK